MKSAWGTHRGDEWWYEGEAIRASAGSSAGVVSIGEIVGARGRFTEMDLHRFLCESMERFAGSRVMVSLNSPLVEPALQALQAKGLVSYEVMASTYSKDAKIHSVSQVPVRASEVATAPAKKRWFFW